ncbi:MAG TPA: hypothetical protein VGD66_02550 [Allosphingosinicella sp.]
MTLKRLQAFERPGYKSTYAVRIVDNALPSGDHGQTIGAKGGVSTTISRFNQKPGDRMYQWGPAEMVNIVGIHEAEHIVIEEAAAVSDECACFLCPCHENAIFSELVGRFQYSLVQPSSSTGKKGWIDNYALYFAKVRKMRADTEYAALCEKMLTIKNRQRFGEAAEEAGLYESDHPPQPPFDSSIGRTIAFDAYKAALSEMEAAVPLFLGEGSFDDVGPFKQVIKDIEKYRTDSDFVLVP